MKESQTVQLTIPATIVHAHEDGNHFEVKIVDRAGETHVLTVQRKEVKPLETD